MLKRLGFALGLAVAFLGASQSANASPRLVLYISTSTGATATVSSTDPGQNNTSGNAKISLSNFVVGDFSIDLTAKTNSPGTAGNGVNTGQGTSQDTESDVHNNGAVAESISFYLIAFGFTNPTTPNAVYLNTGLSSSDHGSVDAVSWTSGIHLNSTGLDYVLPTQFITSADPDSASANAYYGVPANVNLGYNLRNTMTFTNVQSDATASGDGSTKLLHTHSGTLQTLTVVPEPTTAMMAFAALPLLGLGAWCRRKAQV